MRTPSFWLVKLFSWLALFAACSTAVFAQDALSLNGLTKFHFRLEAYDDAGVKHTEDFETLAQNQEQANVFASNKLVVWAQSQDKKLDTRCVMLGRSELASGTTREEPGLLKIQTIVWEHGTPTFKEGQWAGTKGMSATLEGFSVEMSRPIPGVVLEYMAHIQDKGDTAWVTEGTLLRGKPEDYKLAIGPFKIDARPPQRVEGVAFRLTGPNANQYDIWYRGHLQSRGDTDWFKNGEFCGTRGESRRLEAFQLILSRK